MSPIDKIKQFAGRHDKQVDQGLDKAGDVAKKEFAGHDHHIDTAVDKAKHATRPAE